ncbi:MAG: hypothetical protein F6K14_14215 [Symploca sp. SIO2C1]|nr:hypothetical protein [Symploca sp. SIO2C1]
MLIFLDAKVWVKFIYLHPTYGIIAIALESRDRNTITLGVCNTPLPVT